MTRVAVVADLHWTAGSADWSLLKVLRHNSADSLDGVKEFYAKLEDLIEDEEVDRIVLLGDILDFSKNHGLNSLYQRRRGEDERAWTDGHVRLLEGIAGLAKHEKVVYVAGNHEDREKLAELGIDYVDEFEIDGVYFSHGDAFFEGLPYEGYEHPVQRLMRGELKPGIRGLPKRLVRYAAGFLDHALVHNAIGTVGRNFKEKGGEMLYREFLKYADENSYRPRMAVFGHLHYHMLRRGEIPALMVGRYDETGVAYLDILPDRVDVYLEKPRARTSVQASYTPVCRATC